MGLYLNLPTKDKLAWLREHGTPATSQSKSAGKALVCWQDRLMHQSVPIATDEKERAEIDRANGTGHVVQHSWFMVPEAKVKEVCPEYAGGAR